MQKKYGGIKFLIVLAIVGAFVWFLVISPMIQFQKNEKTLEAAARRYFELNPDQLPTGERVKTLSLNTLYKKAYLKEDFKVPNSNKLCSLENSWVKVRRENGEYCYYIYLDCGLVKSSVDHEGPKIKLKGQEEMTIDFGSTFEDPGVASVVDNKDGKIDLENVSIKGSVDPEKVGTYQITYSVFDSLSNKSTVTRTIKIVKKISAVVKNDLGEASNYTGDPENNYVRLSFMDFRIYGFDADNNVILVAKEDVANINFSKIEKWLDEVYLPHFTEEAKNLMVESKFCNMKITNKDLNTTQCTAYTKKRYAYVPSVIDVNRAAEDGVNFMKTDTMSWVGNAQSAKKAYLTRGFFVGPYRDQSFMAYSVTDNFGVRPKIVIRGDALVADGTGTESNPYTFGETTKAKGGSKLGERFSGEYIKLGEYLWRIVDTNEDGTTKVIMINTVGALGDRPTVCSNCSEDTFIYDPKDKSNYGYYINNVTSGYLDASYFVVHEVEAPVYSGKIIYGEEKKVNKYKVKIAPPNMYDMFSAQSNDDGPAHSYWLINSSTNKKRVAAAISDIGVPFNEIPFPRYQSYGVRAVAYVKAGAVISSGKGTINSPYKLK